MALPSNELNMNDPIVRWRNMRKGNKNFKGESGSNSRDSSKSQDCNKSKDLNKNSGNGGQYKNLN